MSNSIYKTCSQYVDLFEKYGQSTGLGSLMIASIAMQESSCNPNSSGDNGGAYGLMQITKDKCGGAPNGNCADPEYNIKTGAQYLADQLKQFDGSLLLAIGQYNGWTKGLTYNQAVAKRSCKCKICQVSVIIDLDLIESCFFSMLYMSE